MTSPTTKTAAVQPAGATTACLFDTWFDPIETAVRSRMRPFIETLIESELEAALDRPRYGRRSTVTDDSAEPSPGAVGHRHGKRRRKLTGTLGTTEIAVPRARLVRPDGGTAARRNGRARRFAPLSAARSPPMR